MLLPFWHSFSSTSALSYTNFCKLQQIYDHVVMVCKFVCEIYLRYSCYLEKKLFEIFYNISHILHITAIQSNW